MSWPAVSGRPGLQGPEYQSYRDHSGWLTRLILILLLVVEASVWLDVLIQPKEYERLVGSESAGGMFKSYCSWPAYVLDNVPFMALSGLAIIGLLWRGLPRRELMLGALASIICLYLAWREYGVQRELAMSEHCCHEREHVGTAMLREPTHILPEVA